jgi:hypothetical protein
MATVDATDARLSTHEEVCALRYQVINARLKRMETIMIGSAGAMIISMSGAVFALLNHVK